MNAVSKLWSILFVLLGLLTVSFFLLHEQSLAKNVLEYRDLISDSGPGFQSNHTFGFVINTNVSPSGRFEFAFPADFELLATSTFGVRNVELRVNGTPRSATTTASPGVDQVEITTGTGGTIKYTLAPDSGISAGSRLEFRIGNNTTGAFQPITTFSTSTGTTTSAGDVEPIVNSSTIGTHKIQMEVYDGGLVANAGFLIAVVNKVSLPNIDTTETVPPYRFNPAPTSTVGGTTLSVEISLETDEFAFCRYSITPDTPFGSMTNLFSNTGLIFHSTVVAVTPDSTQSFYVRCIDDEGNFNIDDFLIVFQVGEEPTGQSNTEGTTDGDGTGTGDSGTGTGSGGGGTSGASDGVAPTTGGSSGSGGSGGGGGGGTGGKSGGSAGGGFESDAAYRSGDARVVISGYSFPNSKVTILVDGQVFDTVNANSSGAYSATLDEIARGVYTFGVYGTGSNGVKSSTFSTSFTVSGARTSELTNINVAPSIKVEPDPVNPGETLTVTGYALPDATVSIQNSRLKAPSTNAVTVTSNSSGFWTSTFNTSSFSKGTYQIRAKSEQSGGVKTNYSEYTFYGVGQSADVPLNTDLNTDGKTNLTDFSILLFWWNGTGGDSSPSADINGDGRVNLTDFSILLFNWTG